LLQERGKEREIEAKGGEMSWGKKPEKERGKERGRGSPLPIAWGQGAL